MKILTFLLILSTAMSSLHAMQSPEQMLAQAMKTRLLQAKNQMTGEGVCWHAAYKGHRFIHAYEKTNNTAYLKAGEQWYDALIAQMYESPDGFKGFVGPAIYSKHLIADCHVGDAILFRIFLGHAEVILKDENLKKEFGEKAQSYLELTKKHLFEKWHARGTWWQNGPFGGYRTFDKFLTPINMKVLQKDYRAINSIGYQFNKQLDMAVCHLRYSRITGDKKHREMARLIYNHSKVRLNLFNDHYVWNYWEPFHPADILKCKQQLALWVATHPYRNYQSGEVHNFIEAFHSGLTFDESDIKRLIQTNLHMWNGDKEKPRWKNSNDLAVNAATGKGKDFIPSKAYPTKAGGLWHSLCEFSPELAEIAKKEATNTEMKRKYDLPVEVFEVPFSSCANINVALVMPAATIEGGYVHFVSKFRSPGKVSILLCNDSGEAIKTLYEEEHPGGNDGQEGILIKHWIVDQPKGTYRIRWVNGEEYRDYRLYVE